MKHAIRHTKHDATPRVVFTPGEPAGIGPDLAVRLAQSAHPCEIVAVADPDLLAERAAALGLSLTLDVADFGSDPVPQRPGRLTVWPVERAAPTRCGEPDPRNARYVLDTLDAAVALCRRGDCGALVTGPVHKAVINDAGIAFDGHTGYLAARCGSGEPVMMLATRGEPELRVALATVHIPLSAVPGAITADGLTHTLRVLDDDLRHRFGIARPRILVAGLNPHAGEGGYLGREEIDVIAPVIEALRDEGLELTGPLPADTLFTPARLRGADAVLAMYHDQGLPVIKHLGFGRTVNVTLGLPIVRTSVDHGTALDIAGTDAVDTGSAEAALAMALDLVAHDR
ncbi:4-hydroxythreonine-4-phosphate dehydrogenase PdxA [Salinisphaera sp. PC39]|uniref:4-hydroxythreonine-4-phosphate dehydrogenase PdxA n=1 Tax=Salinisphaera sp. PC39 TaxID=1304156 RepID=UPI0033424A99